MLLRATEICDRHDVLRAARELDELGQNAAASDVERHLDTVGRERANPPDEALAVGDGLGPSERRYSWLAGLPVPITRAPRTPASWTAALPTLPEAPLISSVLPPPTPSWSSARVAVSMAAGSAAAPGKSSDGGIGA